MFKRRLLSVLFDVDDPGAATPAPAAPAAPEPAAVQPAAPAPPPAPVNDGPWAQDLAQFADPAVRSQVDQFLRSRVQPHVTKIEQDFAPARELWQDLQGDNSISTYIAVAEQLYGAEVAQAVAQQLQQASQAQQPAEPAQQPAAPQLTPEQQDAIDWAETQRAEQLYKSELARVLATDAGATLNAYPPEHRDQIIAPFVQSAGGDFDKAIAAFNQWNTIRPTDAPAPPAPPTTLTAEGAPAAPPPTVPRKQTLDSAIDDVLAEMRRPAPTTVGQV